MATPTTTCPPVRRKSAPTPDAELDGYAWPNPVADMLGPETPEARAYREHIAAGVDDFTPDPADTSVALEAHQAVYGDRQADYGHPREDFTRAAQLWTALLAHKLTPGEHITPDDMARCMIGVKLARDVHAPKRDNRVDMAGYALTLDRLETGQ